MVEVDPRLARYAEAYRILSRTVGYPTQVGLAEHNAREFLREDDAMVFNLGCTNWATSRAAAWSRPSACSIAATTATVSQSKCSNSP